MLVLTAFVLGLRHGVDWDHLAAIGDMAGSQPRRRSAFVLATLYALGHAAVVLGLGLGAVLAGWRLPSGVDAVMGRVVGLTLVLLGVVVLVGLVRDRGRARLRGRWTVVWEMGRRVAGRRHAGQGPDLVEVEHSHPHDHAPGEEHAHAHAHAAEPALAGRGGRRGVAHAHPHRHAAALPADPFAPYSRRTALVVGALHGVGAETPTQLVVLATAAGAGAGGRQAGLLVLLCFLGGLLVSNSGIAVAASLGLLRPDAERPSAWRAGLVALAGSLSLVLGATLLL